MRSNRALLVIVLAGLATNVAAANEIYRCKSPGGAVTYQQQPCPAASDAVEMSIPLSYPDHTAERDRLMQREAAMDARLLKRLEIESAERIARDMRIASERNLQTERERAQTASAPVYIFGWPQRHRLAPRGPWVTLPR